MKRANLSERKDSNGSPITCVISQPVGGSSKQKTQALEAMEKRNVELFASGQNTMQVAEAVNAKEHRVYNILARLGR